MSTLPTYFQSWWCFVWLLLIKQKFVNYNCGLHYACLIQVSLWCLKPNFSTGTISFPKQYRKGIWHYPHYPFASASAFPRRWHLKVFIAFIWVSPIYLSSIWKVIFTLQLPHDFLLFFVVAAVAVGATACCGQLRMCEAVLGFTSLAIR